MRSEDSRLRAHSPLADAQCTVKPVFSPSIHAAINVCVGFSSGCDCHPAVATIRPGLAAYPAAWATMHCEEGPSMVILALQPLGTARRGLNRPPFVDMMSG